MIKKFISTLIDEKELTLANINSLSLIFLLFSVILSMITYKSVGVLWDSHTNIRPTFLSGLVSIALVSPLYLRGILKWKHTMYSLASAFLILSIMASFIELALGGKGFIANTTTATLILAVILGWLGMRALAGSAWMIALALAIYSIIDNNIAMGYWGFLYITFGFLGITLHTKLDPGSFFQELKHDFAGSK